LTIGLALIGKVDLPVWYWVLATFVACWELIKLGMELKEIK